MVNFVYAIGDRATGQAVLVDPAYDTYGLIDLLEADGMACPGVLATHYHPDHVGGHMMGITIEGISRLLERVSVPIHVQATEADLVKKVTGVDDDCLVSHASGDVVMVGAVEIELIATPGHTPGSQCFLVDGRLVAGDTLFLEGCGRMDLPRLRSGPDVREPHHPAGPGARRRGALPRAPLLAGVVGHHGRHPRAQLRVPAHQPRAVAGRLRRLSGSRGGHGRTPVNKPPHRWIIDRSCYTQGQFELRSPKVAPVR